MKYGVFLCCILAVLEKVSSQTSRCPTKPPFTDRIAEFRGHCYQFIRVERFWDDARDFCWAHGGHLVHIPDAATNNFIVGELSDMGWSNSGVWIGLHDRHDEMNWEWVGTALFQPGVSAGWTNWARGHPGASFSRARDCVRMKRSSNWQWHETPCHFLSWHYRFICMNPMTPTTPAPESGGLQGDHNTPTTTTTTTEATTTSTVATTTTTTEPTTTSKLDRILWQEYEENKGAYDIPESQRLMSETEEKSNGMVYIIVGASGGGLLLVVIGVVFLLRRRRQRKSSHPAVMDIQYPPKFDNPLYAESEGGVAQALLNNESKLQKGNIYVSTEQMTGTGARLECIEDPYLCPVENREKFPECQASMPDDRRPLPARPSDVAQTTDYLPMNGGDSHIYAEIPGGDPVNTVYQSLDDI